MSDFRVVVAGGGLAGLSAAIACLDAGLRVTLLEARSRLGGATWSTRHQGMWIDNGQHVFLRCCTAYRGFLRRLGVEGLVHLQDRLSLPVVAPGGRIAWLRRDPMPAPLHLAPSLLRFTHLPLRQRIRVGLTARKLARLRLSDPALDERGFGDWLAEQGESAGAVDRFWDLIVRPALNLPAREASLALAAKVFQAGLLERADAGDLGWATVPLQQIHADPAMTSLQAGGADVRLRAPVDRIDGGPDGVRGAWVRGSRVDADAVILATPHAEATELLPAEAGIDAAGLRGLGHAPIVDLHVVYERRVTNLPFAAGVETPLQWVFDRSAAAGLDRSQYLVVSLSAAGDYVGLSAQDLSRIFLPELERILPAARGTQVERFFTTCERRATFRQAPGTRRHRPGPETAMPGLFLAGAWTATGWPATMESAVRSGMAAARCALIRAGCERGLPAEAA